jgi:hypothetical protein
MPLSSEVFAFGASADTIGLCLEAQIQELVHSYLHFIVPRHLWFQRPFIRQFQNLPQRLKQKRFIRRELVVFVLGYLGDEVKMNVGV